MLSAKDQVSLLYDLVSEQSEDCCGTLSECQQIQRIARSLLSRKNISDENVLKILPAIYEYSLQAESTSDLNEHITSNQDQLTEWAASIQNIKY
ncbi:YtzH-like family protein [Pontibacillus salicampi]|uniref:YtzH-like family protein n=1 Tax=Pontibacillus salicampi TaxID=1449801 RepID=A0ABV6LIW1_9BACI